MTTLDLESYNRSHLVFSVYVVATPKSSSTSATTGATLRGKLHLIDLAGSERLSKTGAQVRGSPHLFDGSRSGSRSHVVHSSHFLGLRVIVSRRLRTSTRASVP